MTESRPTSAQPLATSTTTTSTATTTVVEPAARRPLGLSLTQIAGGALAAVTAAVAASFFGVAGTLTGAALGSIVSSVGAALDSTSLSRAARVSKVLVVRPAGAGTGPLEASAQDPAAVPPVVAPEPLAAARPAWWSRLRWRSVAAVAGLLFVAAMAAIWVSERALGHPLGDTGAKGTTLTNLGGSGAAPAQQPVPGQDGTAPTPSASVTPEVSGTPSVSPSPSSTGSPDPTPTATAQPTPTGTGTAAPTTSTGTGTGTAPAPAPTAPASR